MERSGYEEVKQNLDKNRGRLVAKHPGDQLARILGGTGSQRAELMCRDDSR